MNDFHILIPAKDRYGKWYVLCPHCEQIIRVYMNKTFEHAALVGVTRSVSDGKLTNYIRCRNCGNTLTVDMTEVVNGP